jgi:hypothetical protein
MSTDSHRIGKLAGAYAALVPLVTAAGSRSRCSTTTC